MKLCGQKAPNSISHVNVPQAFDPVFMSLPFQVLFIIKYLLFDCVVIVNISSLCLLSVFSLSVPVFSFCHAPMFSLVLFPCLNITACFLFNYGAKIKCFGNLASIIYANNQLLQFYAKKIHIN